MSTKEKIYCVYKHTNKINGKVYIGKTCANPPEKRWRNDGSGYIKSPLFWKAIQKYGWDGFTHEIISTGLTKKRAEEMEIELILKYDSIKNGYNRMLGSIPSETTLGYKPTTTEEGLEKLRAYWKLSKIEKIKLLSMKKFKKKLKRNKKDTIKDIGIRYVSDDYICVEILDEDDFPINSFLINVRDTKKIDKISILIAEELFERKDYNIGDEVEDDYYIFK